MFDLHYWPTPNGKKVTILLEELGAEYRVIPCNIGRGDQFSPRLPEAQSRITACRSSSIARRATAGAAQRLRVGRDHDLHRREGGRLPSAECPRQGRGDAMGDLADGEPGPEARRMRTFSPAGRYQGRPELRGPPLHRRSQPALRCSEQPALRSALPRRRCLYDRRHDLLSLGDELAGPGAGHRGVPLFRDDG